MKKNLTFVVLLVLTMHVGFSQFTPGQKVLGGTVGFNYGNTKDTSGYYTGQNNWSFGINPSFGKFINDKTLAEVHLSFRLGNQKYESQSNTSTQRSWSAGIGYVRTRLYPIASKVYFTLGNGIDINYQNQKSENKGQTTSPNQKANSYGLSLGITPGILIPVRNNRILLRTSVSNLLSASYFFSKIIKTPVGQPESSSTQQSGSLSFGSTSIFNQLTVGISWLLK